MVRPLEDVRSHQGRSRRRFETIPYRPSEIHQNTISDIYLQRKWDGLVVDPEMFV
jgi:hypothetical protein